jgi:alkylhydroperoxidase/carboxymuconolactone decarboxylase family protein YurZ
VARDASSREEFLHELADGDVSGLDRFVRGDPAGGAGLDPETLQLAQIAALAAVDASAVSWFAHLNSSETELSLDKILDTLVAVTAIVGTPRIVSAAANIISATGLGEEIDDNGV